MAATSSSSFQTMAMVTKMEIDSQKVKSSLGYKMDVNRMYGNVYTMSGILVVTSMMGWGIGIVNLPTTPNDCTTGEFEAEGMTASWLLTFFCSMVAILSAIVGRLEWILDGGLTKESPPPKLTHMMILLAYTLLTTGIVTLCVEIFFVVEVMTKKFLCQHLLLQCLVPTVAVIVLLVWCRIILLTCLPHCR